MASPIRVALLAAAGGARDQLHRALTDFGADIVVEGDPVGLDPEAVAGFAPDLLVISLDPASEAVLDRFDRLLSSPGIQVIYDDAEVTRQLDGWELNRWARHLAAKLLGEEALLPPRGAAEPMPDFGSLKWEVSSSATLDTQFEPPIAEDDAAAVSQSAKATIAAFEELETDAGHDASPIAYAIDLTQADDTATGEPGTSVFGDDATESKHEADFRIDMGFDFELDSSSNTSAAGLDSGAGTFDLSSIPERFAGLQDDAAADSELGDVGAEVAALAAQLDAFEKPAGSEQVRDLDFAFDLEPNSPVESATAQTPIEPTKPAGRSFGHLTLVDIDETASLLVPDPVAEASKRLASTDLDLVPLEEHSNAQYALGAVLILAGMGGPDAVRQLLARLPTELPVPVLLQQSLEVGKMERLAEQLAKISSLPVVLAEADSAARVGKVHVLPTGLATAVVDRKLHFVPGDLSSLITSLSSVESVVVVLSGAPVELVPAILAMQQAGGLVLAQSPGSCFEPAAVNALHSAGVAVYAPPILAEKIAVRWSLKLPGANR